MQPGKALTIGTGLLLLCAGYQEIRAAVTLGPWQIRHPHPSAFSRDVAFDGTKYVLVDDYGHIFTSVGARNWTRQQTPGVRRLMSVAYGRTNFVTVGPNGWILSSPDGTNWVNLASGTTNDLARIAFIDDRFIVTGNAILTSTDGLNFTVEEAQTPNYLRSIASGPGTLVAAGENAVLVSTNRGEWKQALVTTTNLFSGVEYFKGAYHNGWYSTTNPMVWTNRLGSTTFTNMTTVVASSNIIGRVRNGNFEWSLSGGAWFKPPGVEARPLYSVRTFGNRFHLVGGDAIYFGDNATQFRPMHLRLGVENDATWFTKVWGDTNGYAARDFFKGRSYYSPDGHAWRLREVSDPLVDTNDIAWAIPPFARVSGASLQRSADGVEWQSMQKPPDFQIFQAAALGEVVVASGMSNLWATVNGTNWTKVSSKMGPSLGISEGGAAERVAWISSLTAGHGILAATTSWGELLFSTNGFQWETNVTTLQRIDDLTFTRDGILVSSLNLLAAARFDGGTEPMPATRIKVEGSQFRFEGPLRFHEIESATDLGAPVWTVFRRTATNTVWGVSEVDAPAGAFFRAVQRD
jgi:hypothetical protein